MARAPRWVMLRKGVMMEGVLGTVGVLFLHLQIGTHYIPAMSALRE